MSLSAQRQTSAVATSVQAQRGGLTDIDGCRTESGTLSSAPDSLLGGLWAVHEPVVLVRDVLEVVDAIDGAEHPERE